jgi:hypothetical protein
VRWQPKKPTPARNSFVDSTNSLRLRPHSGSRKLNIASDPINDTNLRAAYGEILRVAAEMVTPYLDPFRVKLIPTSNPLAQAAVEIHQRCPGRMAIRLNSTNFGGLGVDGVFIYPASQNIVTP